MIANDAEKFKKVISHAKEYGYIFQSSEIYDGLSAVYDYGPYGALLKNNIKEYWWKAMVQMHENIVGLDSAILMHPTTWKASGHVDAFSDPLIDNKDSKKRYRADNLIEEKLEKLKRDAIKTATKSWEKKYNRKIHELIYEVNGKVITPIVEFLEDNEVEIPFVLHHAYTYQEKPYWIGEEIIYFQLFLENKNRDYEKLRTFTNRFKNAIVDSNLEELRSIIIDLEIVDPISGTRNWTDVRQFNLMFSTSFGAASDSSDVVYLRPETAQGIFVNFLNVQKTTRQKIPFGIAQIGKAFRNEIVARQFIFRMREFEQMEMQFFVRPGEEMNYYNYWKKTRMLWHRALGTDASMLQFHDHDKVAHYANAAVDIEFKFPFGFKELEGIHSRTNFDLSRHTEFSGKKLQYFDPELNENYIPYVVETSIGCDRMFLAMMCNAYDEEGVGEETRVVLRLPAILAPIKVAVLPLIKKDGLPEKAMEIFNTLKFNHQCYCEEKDSIGKRYRRMDAIGTPYCITVDHQTLEDNTVTIRERDSMQQERIAIADVLQIVNAKVDINTVLKQLVD